MDSLRVLTPHSIAVNLPCCRCGRGERCWDRIADKAYCPNCQEMLALGEGPPLVERTEKHRCAVCNKVGTVCFHTFPLQASRAVAIDLCPEHLRGLIGRRLGPYAFNQLRRQLRQAGVGVDELFLLHGAFYDSHGRALHPAVDLG
jgi:hypothetical protein